MNLESLDWEVLDRLRATFLSDARTEGPYWHTLTDLECYDLTYAERIGWKWDAVLDELRLRGWTAPAGATVLDWGCGSGVAGRRVVRFLDGGAESGFGEQDFGIMPGAGARILVDALLHQEGGVLVDEGRQFGEIADRRCATEKIEQRQAVLLRTQCPSKASAVARSTAFAGAGRAVNKTSVVATTACWKLPQRNMGTPLCHDSTKVVEAGLKARW